MAVGDLGAALRKALEAHNAVVLAARQAVEAAPQPSPPAPGSPTQPAGK